MSSEPLGPESRRIVTGLVEETLQRARVIDELPTDLEAVREAAGVEEILDMSALPDELAARKPAKWKRILGAFWYQQKTVFIDRSESSARQRFTDAHEAVHALCPWHEVVIRLDNRDTLEGRGQIEVVEAEANYGSGHILFQGHRFHRRALLEQVSIRTPLELVGDYGASRHAAIHYYVEEHPDEVALLVAGRLKRLDGSVPIWRSIESPSFRKRFGRLEDRLPGRKLKLTEGDDAPLARICIEAQVSLDPPSTKLSIPDLRGRRRRFVAEAFYNQHCYFILVASERSRKLGRRSRLQQQNERELVVSGA
jgi:IrrE N-terminal-like domain